jgi:hypothetical protein
MTADQWVILRLLAVIAGGGNKASPDFLRAILYLRKQVGPKTLDNAITQLRN